MEKLRQIAEKYGTPVLVMDLNVIANNYRQLIENINNCKVYYAVKSNSHIEIVKFLKDMGSHFDVASRGEIEKLLSIGVEPSRMSFGNTIKKIEDIKFAYEVGIRMFAVDAEMEIEKIALVAPNADIYVRISTNGMEGDADWPLTRKFGTSVNHAIELVRYAKEKGLNPIGLSFHVGSQNYNPENWRTAIREASIVFEEAKQFGVEMKMINTGGGMPVRYVRDIPSIKKIAKVINEAVEEYLGNDITVIVEPGRSMVGNAGVMISRVILRSKKGDENWLYLDAGVFHGLTETIQNIRYRITVDGKEDEELEKFVLAGPTCDSVDVMYYDAMLPKSTTLGDIVYFFATGAYTTEYGTNFNGIASPSIIFENGILSEEIVEGSNTVETLITETQEQ
ncbi:type III PLP-dependent enzyme [Fervidobacterium nodosum]|uniref:ornithine decarboxylase n=1 Tax=Fervidobacterium nodosum (strain ATCC 35602 / DSM 5306 / Rt17-B1) TaxID=381764 RepID=A7HKV6_FERNB|nr:type III PLP-dependent enzyme [Fervidobacterium nodosum]ABS60539.1 Orn/DAP/Arg decarboxylase 2 [Fervidobacterium nodosum Rt17-B1]PHJ14096.1 ornithine decarboxylase [Fervidobacterium sp. SC_NGM5_G05]HOJ93717.1 type III PLP-dependent enzyme [Fervidobacterium nodosum]